MAGGAFDHLLIVRAAGNVRRGFCQDYGHLFAAPDRLDEYFKFHNWEGRARAMKAA